VPFDFADNSTSPSVILQLPPYPYSSCHHLVLTLLTPCTVTTTAAAPLISSLLPSEAFVPLLSLTLKRWPPFPLSLQSIVARGVYTPNKLETVTPCPTLAGSYFLYLPFMHADFLLMALVDNCHKLPSWFHFPLSSPKILGSGLR